MKPLTLRQVFHNWWPLAASWLFMGIELPLISAVMARLADPTISLAAYGGVVFPIAMIIEAPIIMLLSTSTALSKDLASYLRMRKFMLGGAAGTTLVHIALAFTPLFDLVVVGWMQVPPEIVEPARIGLRIMVPWSASIAYRRFQQGVLIRFGHSKAVSIGTALRLSANALVLAVFWQIDGMPGIVVGASGIAAGVLAEAIYAGWRVRPVVRGQLAQAQPVQPPLRWSEFYAFYIPLAATSFINLVVQPMGSAALSRMPLALASLAAWPVVSGFLFMWRSLGFAFSEVVVAMLDYPDAVATLRRFRLWLSAAITAGLTLTAVSPIGRVWFESISGLQPDLVQLSLGGLWIALLWPAISVFQNYYQGVIVHGRKTWAVTVSILVFVAFTASILIWGSVSRRYTGLYVGMVAFQVGYAAQALCLWWFGRPIVRRKRMSDLRQVGAAAGGE